MTSVSHNKAEKVYQSCDMKQSLIDNAVHEDSFFFLFQTKTWKRLRCIVELSKHTKD